MTSDQCKFDAGSRALKASALGQPRGIGGEESGRFRIGGHVYLWLIHVNVWPKPPHYCKIIILPLKYIFFKVGSLKT